MENIFKYKDCFKEIEAIPVLPVLENQDDSLLFTFAVPTYSRPDTLDQTLQSILKQNNSIQFNIIVCDNNPVRNDSTEQLILEKYKNVPRFSYYKNAENIYSHGNWNRLVMLCKTQYLILIHDDDLLFDGYLDNIIHLQSSFPQASAINVGTQIWNGIDIVNTESSKKKYRVIKDTVYTNFAFFCFQAPTGCLFKVSDLVETGGFNFAVGPSFDYTNVLTMCLQNKEVIHYEKPLVLYRWGENASSDMKVQLLQVDGDNLMRQHLGEVLHLPRCYVRFTCWLKTKERLRALNKKNTVTNYKGWTPGGFWFAVLNKLFTRVYMDIWVRRMHCLNIM